jgi:hypothetical protein
MPKSFGEFGGERKLVKSDGDDDDDDECFLTRSYMHGFIPRRGQQTVAFAFSSHSKRKLRWQLDLFLSWEPLRM